MVWTFVLTRTGLYSLSKDLGSKANALRSKQTKNTGKMKAHVLRERMEKGGHLRKIVGETGQELQDLGTKIGKTPLNAGKRLWRLGNRMRDSSEDVESNGTQAGLFGPSKPV